MNLTGTKFGCGIGQCGARPAHMQNQALRLFWKKTGFYTYYTQSILCLEGKSICYVI